MTEHQLQRTERAFAWADLAVGGLLLALIYAIVTVARQWGGQLQPVAAIHLEGRYLPLYALFSLTRGVIAYAISFLFTMVYGYVMARVMGAERVLLPLLDILQSIPVLGFLPGFVLGLVHLFPHQNFGLEMASVLMIFTGQVWNMTFSFYSSLKSVPPDLVAVARLAQLSWWQRFLRLDLSYAATGLVWNSMMSMAGGWFFLTVSEAFVLGEHDFRLPGLGSYMSLAIERGDARAEALGVLGMLAMIALLDQLVWRPVVAWSQKFTDEERGSASGLWLWERLRRAGLWRLAESAWRRAKMTLAAPAASGLRKAASEALGGPKALGPDPDRYPGPANHSEAEARSSMWRQGARRVLLVTVGIGAAYGFVRYVAWLSELAGRDWLYLAGSTATTFVRVILAVALASVWTIPAGVLIGRTPRLARALQPLIQMAASFPAPMIFPVVVGVMLAFGAGLGVSSVVLLMLGTQWYVLFNVIAGSSAIPHDLLEVARLARFSWRDRWQKLILPAIFPYLLTGWITALGGAWNASIVAEYMKYKGRTLSTTGLGAAISLATEQGNFHLLAAAVGLMAVTVVGFNRLVWRPLSFRAQTRFTLST
jgi:NitT/TauT family transport system permease protein